MRTFEGEILFLDRSDINTDEIIPAKYLTEISKQALGPHLLEDLVLEGFDPDRDIHGTSVIVTRKNFGCGSSREHAPWALEANGITLVIAENFARIFRQNMFNCGMMAVELPGDQIDRLFAAGGSKSTGLKISADLDTKKISVRLNDTEQDEFVLDFTISPFDEKLVRAGGWVEFADAKY
jgi:3-isopropylmalate/(R)-2-methylmalate dehydratase small subunit